MLVLTRNVGERIVIPELGVTIAVSGILGDKVRIGVIAPQNATILREELLSRPKKRAQEERA